MLCRSLVVVVVVVSFFFGVPVLMSFVLGFSWFSL